MKKIPTIYTLVRQHYPGLIFNIEAIIRESEQEYCKHQQEDADSFLWEHTTQVAAMAAKLAVEEGTHPLHPVIAALFHDCGKFDCGCYHEDDTPEEEHSARRAEQLLAEAGMPDKDIRDILGSLIALYNEDLQDNDLTNIVHDADFLVKSGPMGIAGFFTKAALRGKSMQRAILEGLSKELTYAYHLPGNMRTKAGKTLAIRKQSHTFAYFEALVDDLRESNIADYRIQKHEVQACSSEKSTIEIYLVLPNSCPMCSGAFNPEFSTKKDIKCTKLFAELICDDCGDRKEISFCLPEIAGGG